MSLTKRKSSTKVTVILPDVHLSATSRDGIRPIDRHDSEALSVAFQIIKDIQPDRIVQLGDLLHFGQISGFARKKDMLGKAPSEDGETISVTIERDIELANIFWDTVQSLSKAKEYDFLQGNHDLILDKARQMNLYAPYVNKSWYLQEALHLKDRGINYTKYERFNGSKNWITEGKLNICHGFYSGGNHLDAHFRMFQSNVCYGHLHSYGAKSFASVDSIKGAWCIGTLSTKYASYVRSAASAWRQGCALVYSQPNGKFNLYFIDIVGGHAVWAGKIYTAKRLVGLQ